MRPRLVFLLVLQFLVQNAFSQIQNDIIQLELKLIKGEYDSVIYFSNKLIEEDSIQPYAFYYLGKAYQECYKYVDAEIAFKKAFDQDSTNITFQNGLAETYESLGKDEEAIDIYYSQYLADTIDISPIINLANIFRKNREFGTAIHYYQKALEIDPNNYYYNKSIAFCFDQINMVTPAILYYQRAIEINPYDINVHIILANILNGERRFKEAIEVCKKGLEINPQEVQLKKLLAYTYYLNREFDLSIQGFNELLANSDSVFFNLKYRGLAFYESQLFDKAIIDLKEANAMNADDPEVAFYIGSALGRIGELAEGSYFLNLTIRMLAPPAKQMANIYSELSTIELKKENYMLSLDYLKMAYQAEPDPIYSFKMAQLYDQYLGDKKLAINYYDGYLTMMKERKTENMQDSVSNSNQSVYKEFALHRIKILTEELFFEEK
ncbi:MAG: tetratricopeptide repeat protein [Bacteroidales bacterium]